MRKLFCKVVAAFAGALVAGAIAFAAATFFSDFAGVDLVGIVFGVVAGAVVCLLVFEKLCVKKN